MQLVDSVSGGTKYTILQGLNALKLLALRHYLCQERLSRNDVSGHIVDLQYAVLETEVHLSGAHSHGYHVLLEGKFALEFERHGGVDKDLLAVDAHPQLVADAAHADDE